MLVLGGGELGSAVAHRLVRAGFGVLIADLAQPTCIRRSVSFATALTEGSTRVEGVGAARAASVREALSVARAGMVPVVAVSEKDGSGTSGKSGTGRLARAFGAQVVVDARMLKRAGVISRRSAPLVVGLGPGLRAPRDAHAVIETNRGHNLGRVVWKGEAQRNTGTPGEIAGRRAERLIRAPASGVFKAHVPLGTMVGKDDIVGAILPGRVGIRNLSERFGTPVSARIPGLLRGLIADGVAVSRRQKIGDVDPRGRAVDPFTISDKARAVAGGALEAIMSWWATRDARP